MLDDRSSPETLGHACQDRFTTAEYAATPGLAAAAAAAGGGGSAIFKHHWAWYLPREWATIQAKLRMEGLKGSSTRAAALLHLPPSPSAY